MKKLFAILALCLAVWPATAQTNRAVATLPTNTAPAKLLAVTSAGASVQVPLATVYGNDTNAAKGVLVTSNSISDVRWQIGTNAERQLTIGYKASENWTYDADNNGHGSTVIGLQAGRMTPRSDGSVFLGTEAGYNAGRGHYSTLLGTYAGHDATNSYNSVMVGYGAGQGASNAYGSVIIGANAGRYNLQQDMTTRVGGGIHGGWAVSGPGYGPAESTNYSVWYSPLELNSTFGYAAGDMLMGDRNTMLGAYAGTGEWGDWSGSSTNDSLSTYIGFAAGRAWGAPTLTNAIAIGARAKATNSNQTVIGNTSSTELRVPLSGSSLFDVQSGTGSAINMFAWYPSAAATWAQSNAFLTAAWNATILNAPLTTAGPWFEQQALIRGWFGPSGGFVVRNGYDAGADPTAGAIYAEKGVIAGTGYSFSGSGADLTSVQCAAWMDSFGYTTNAALSAYPGYLQAYANKGTIGSGLTPDHATGSITNANAGTYSVTLQMGQTSTGAGGDYKFLLRTNNVNVGEYFFDFHLVNALGYGGSKQVIVALPANTFIRAYLSSGPNYAPFTNVLFKVERLR